MKFTKTLIVIAIVLGLMVMCIVGCFADTNFCTFVPSGVPVPKINYEELYITEAGNGYLNFTDISINGYTKVPVIIDGATEEWNIYCVTTIRMVDLSMLGQSYYLAPNREATTSSSTRFKLFGWTGDSYAITRTSAEYFDYLDIDYIDGNNFFSSDLTICEITEKGVKEDMTVVEQVLGVFNAIGEWFAEIIPSMLGVFYNAETNTLTVIGVLAVCSLAIAVILLILAWICDFFKFRR